MKPFIFSILLSFLVITLHQSAQASSWLRCEISGKIIQKENNTYQIEVLSGTVLEGHVKEGTSCLKEGDTHDIELEDNTYNISEEIKLIYEHYNSMTPDGYTESTDWMLGC